MIKKTPGYIKLSYSRAWNDVKTSLAIYSKLENEKSISHYEIWIFVVLIVTCAYVVFFFFAKFIMRLFIPLKYKIQHVLYTRTMRDLYEWYNHIKATSILTH